MISFFTHEHVLHKQYIGLLNQIYCNTHNNIIFFFYVYLVVEENASMSIWIIEGEEYGSFAFMFFLL